METILLSFYILVLVGFVLFVLVVEKYKRKAVVQQERSNHLEDVLASAPEGFYLEIWADKKAASLCSRRLCLMLNIVEQTSELEAVSRTLSKESRQELGEAFEALKMTGSAFELVVQNTLNLMHFKVRGSLLETPYREQKAFVLWFENISYTTVEFTENALKNQCLIDEKDTFYQAVNTLPFPVSIEHLGSNPFFKNALLTSEAEDLSDLHWQEVSYKVAGDTLILRYGQDKATEEGLNALLIDAERAHRATLKELSCAVCLFDSSTRLVFYNKAFADLWKLEPAWLKREPFYEDFLNKLQEKGFLPQVKDFAQYKKIQKDLFSRLTKPFEDFIYLQNACIVRRLMIPHAQGGILFIDEPKGAEK